jgi:SAM-dependent methyltransferase
LPTDNTEPGALTPSERAVLGGYSTEADAQNYEAKTRKGPLRRLSAARERSLVLKALGPVSAESLLLDVPCGAGRLLPALAGRGRVVGLDVSAFMLDQARSAGRPLVLGSALRLPFVSGAFEVVVSVRLLHHYAAKARGEILAELARVARRRVVVTVFDQASFKHRRRMRREAVRGRPSLRYAVSVPAFLDEMRAAGLRPGRVRRLLPGYAELTVIEGDVA